MEHSADVIIVGAGASGIACAQQLSLSGTNFKILEARPRLGGRIYSHVEPGMSTGIELGAEYIHGAPQRMLELFRRLHLPFYDVNDEHYFLKNNKLIKIPDYWEKMKNILDKLSTASKTDRSLEEFIRRQHLTSEMKKNFVTYVEGFHAADLRLIGEKGLASTKSSKDDSLNGSELFRPLYRYDQIFAKMADWHIEHNRLHLSTVVKKINWKKNEVTLTCLEGPAQVTKNYSCKKLILSLPIAVLQSDSIEWNKWPKDLRESLFSINMGHVQKIVFRFHERFWEDLSESKQSYFHAGPEFYFPTWWNHQPLRTPYLMAWQGGPKALQMSNWSDEEKVHTAIQTLSRITQKSFNFINSQIESWFSHNWSTDPFSRGAYSYIALDGLKKAKRLKKPFDDTIYIIGEGTAVDSSRATVHGAFESGWNLDLS